MILRPTDAIRYVIGIPMLPDQLTCSIRVEKRLCHHPVETTEIIISESVLMSQSKNRKRLLQYRATTDLRFSFGTVTLDSRLLNSCSVLLCVGPAEVFRLRK